MKALIEMRQRAQAELDRLRSGKTCVYIDTGICGSSAGSLPIFEQFSADVARQKIGVQIVQAGSLGWRDVEPLIAVAKPGQPKIYYRNVTPALATELIASVIVGGNVRPDLALAVDGSDDLDGIPPLASLPFFATQQRISLRNAGYVDPEDLNDALVNGAYAGGYTGLARALAMPPESVIDEIERAGLRGRNGAGAALADRWRCCRQAGEGKRYVIGNASPGLETSGAAAGKFLLESDPHSVLEGMLIAAYAVGADQAYLCIDPDHGVAMRRAAIALEQMRDHQLVGESILDSKFNCQIEIREAPRGLAGGEETILISALEGRQPHARIRPPHPETEGLFSRPTAVDDVESLTLVAAILQKDTDWFRSLGTKECPGTKIVALNGAFERSGFVEVPMGTLLRQIAMEIGGGARSGSELKAVQIGGPAGGWLTAAELDIALDYEQMVNAGCTLGSGSLLAADTTACAVDLARQALVAAHRGSCGKCTFGREGTRQLRDILTDLAKGRGTLSDLDLMLDLSDGMKAGSLCANGRNAPDAVLTTLRRFRSEFEAHAIGKHCPANVCDRAGSAVSEGVAR
jgi:NADH-quinone oxidoreductase subunit F